MRGQPTVILVQQAAEAVERAVEQPESADLVGSAREHLLDLSRQQMRQWDYWEKYVRSAETPSNLMTGLAGITSATAM